MNAYHVGDLVRISATFTDINGAAADPTTVTLLVKLRYVIGATTTTYTYGGGGTITKSGTGVYYQDFTPTTEGIWDYRWIGTGAIQAADEGAFNVPNSEFFSN